jgi:hypothetical protein
MTYARTMLGRWDEALRGMSEIPDEKIGRIADLLSPLSGPLELLIQRGELDEARRLLACYDEVAQVDDVQAWGCYQAAASAVALAEGRPRDALVVAEEVLAMRTAVGMAAQNIKLGFLHGVEAALALGDLQKADELVSLVEELPPGIQPPFLTALAHRFRARLAGDDPGAVREFVSAAAQLRELEMPFYLAVVLLEHGEWLAAQGRSDDAQPLLGQARETFERLGATPWLDRLGAGESEPPAVLA